MWDDEEEARTIGDDIEAMQKRSNQPLNEVAILVRASFQMRAFEDRFITMGLPYRVIGGPRFYERQEIKDAIAYLEIAANPANDLKFERIINVPKRGLGDTSVKRVHELGARAVDPDVSGGADDHRDRGAARQGAQVARRPRRQLRALAQPHRPHEAHRARRADLG